MKTMRNAFAGLVLALVAGAVVAQQWPSKPIKWVVPFAPGGTTDILARTIGEKLSVTLGQPIIVDNKPGAGGGVGADQVAKSPADGYTIMGGTISTHAINASLYSNLPYDPVRDFAPITLIVRVPNMLVVNPELPAKDVRELIALLKASPGKYSFASSGNGTSQHLSGELFKTMTGVEMQHIPYRGSPPALADVVGGQVAMTFDNITTAWPLVKGGKLRALAVTTAKRSPIAPDVPTLAESGLPGYEIGSWQGVFAPAGVSTEIVKRLNTEIVRIINAPDVRQKLVDMGAEPAPNTPEEFAAMVKAEVAKWADVVRKSGAKVD
ncbi:MAG: tripartite tricarboxylate transporter substrate binding protein [Betaproteobacteria bacterium]|nr:MAG: tripartite tricarboxylate transporter substrate binding protein [Betaproteobacteria bacterium]